MTDARRRHKSAVRSLKSIEDWLATDPPITNDIDVVGAVCEATTEALDALREILGVKAAGLKQQLAQARKDLDERGGHIKRMDIVDLGSAAAAGLISQAAYEQERFRRAKNLSRPVVHRTSSTPYGGAVASGLMPCGEPGCWTAVDLSKNGSGYCPEHVHLEPRTFITAGFQPVDLDANLHVAEQSYERARREYEAADEQLKAAREAIERFDASHRA